MKQKIICCIVALMMLIPCVYISGCGKQYTPQEAVNYVSAEITAKYNNTLITSRNLEFNETIEYGDQEVHVEYNSADERIVNNRGTAYPTREMQSVDVEVKVSCEDQEKSFKIYIRLPANEWENNNVVNNTRDEVCIVLESAWSIWDKNTYVYRYQFRVYNNTTSTINCFNTLNGKIMLNNEELSKLNSTHSHETSPIKHDTKSWEFGYPRKMSPGTSSILMVDDTRTSNYKLFNKTNRMTFEGELTVYTD